MIAKRKKLSKIEKGLLKITIDKKFKGLYSIWRNNGNGWKAKVRTNKEIKYMSIWEIAEIYQKKYPGKEIGLRIY